MIRGCLTSYSFPYGELRCLKICRLFFLACVKWDLLVAFSPFEFRFRCEIPQDVDSLVRFYRVGFRPIQFHLYLFDNHASRIIVKGPLRNI